MKRARLWLALGALAACRERTVTMVPVEVHGVPVCPQEQGLNRLRHPLAVEASAGADRILRYATGASPGELGLRLPDRGGDWHVRFGLCETPTDPGRPAYACGEPKWYAEVALRPEKSGGYVLRVPSPPDGACWRGTAATD